MALPRIDDIVDRETKREKRLSRIVFSLRSSTMLREKEDASTSLIQLGRNSYRLSLYDNVKKDMKMKE